MFLQSLRSSRRLSIKTVLENFVNVIGKHLCRSLAFLELCEILQNFKSTLFQELYGATAFEFLAVFDKTFQNIQNAVMDSVMGFEL